METVKLSPEYQVTIPKVIRKRMKLLPGQILQIIDTEDRIEFILVKEIKESRGFLKGLNTEMLIENDRM
ncbi:MAG: AbrB/MazE/SpoVT family DNA-binding domain-containing protein [Ignavibacteria bacterium]|jgi:AbrB family looped-hinge helix DNA binding protein|nr:AbrB/MazE/SpoVT family DNA-binding domain-containing protein [Ignavibacteria bacterium]